MSSPESLPLEDRAGASAPPAEACALPGEPARNGPTHPAGAPEPGPAAEKSADTSEPSSAKAEPEERSRVDRAEEVVDRLALQMATFTSFLGRKIIHIAARVREEAEDLWAEAQNIRRGDKKP